MDDILEKVTFFPDIEKQNLVVVPTSAQNWDIMNISQLTHSEEKSDFLGNTSIEDPYENVSTMGHAWNESFNGSTLGHVWNESSDPTVRIAEEFM